MSTKIHNGYRLPSDLTLSTLMTWVHGIRPVLKKAALDTAVKESLEEAVKTLDLHALARLGFSVSRVPDNDSNAFSPMRKAWYGLLQDAREASRKGHRHFLDAEADLTVFVYGSELYAMLFSSMGTLQTAFSNLPGVESFAYSNATDAPPGFTQEQWDQRGDLWDELLGPGGLPSTNGLSVQLVEKDFLILEPFNSIQTPERLALVPSLSARTFWAAEALPEGALPEKAQAELRENPGRLSIVMRHLRDLKEGRVPEFNAAREKVQGLLDQELTWDKLNYALGVLERP